MRTTQHSLAGGSETASPLWLRPVPVVALLGVLTALIYLNSLGNEFVFDDRPLIVNYSRIKSLSNIPRVLGVQGRRAYRPIRTASYAVDYFLFGLNPAGFRSVNIGLHVLNSALIFFLFRALTRNPRPALLGAILFAVHPIQTESVAYISGRRDLLFTLFYLVGFASYVRYRETDRIRYLALGGFAYLLSIFSKEMGISLPVLCIAYDMVRAIPTAEGKGPLASWRAAVGGIQASFRRHRTLYLVGGVLLLCLLWYFAYLKNPSRQRKLYGGSMWATLLTSTRIFAHYIKLLVLPVTLNADYSFNAFPLSRSLADVRVIFALVILGGTWWGISYLLDKNKWAAFGGFWFFIALLPVSQIIPHHEMMAEHYLYLPSAGFFLTASLLVERSLAQERHRAAIVAVCILVIALLGIRTAVRNRDWRDSETLWKTTIRTAPGSARAHTNVGELALRKGRLSEAYREFREAIRILPDDATNRQNIGILLLRYGQFESAEREFREALRFRESPKLHVNLGLIYLNKAELDDAERELRTALDYKSGKRVMKDFRALVLNNLGIVLALKGKSQEAERAFEDAVRLSPRYADPRANLGKAYIKKGMTQQGVEQLAEAIRLKGSDARFHFMLGEAYYQRGDKELAALELAKSLSLKTDFPEARNLLNKIIREKGSERGKRG